MFQMRRMKTLVEFMSRWATIFAMTMAALLVGCGGGSGEAPASPVPDRPDEPAAVDSPVVSTPPEASKDEAECLGAGDGERLEVMAGKSATSRSGLRVTFEGATHDNYGDGHTDLLLQLYLFDENEGKNIPGWMPSAFAKPAYSVFGGYCVRVMEGSTDKVVLHVLALDEPSDKPLPRCHPSCCPPDMQEPSPDGTVECCFCDEAPDWNRKDAHRFCASAIDAYPDVPAPPCQAMHMCANEASLSIEQSAKLLDMIRKTDGCAQP